MTTSRRPRGARLTLVLVALFILPTFGAVIATAPAVSERFAVVLRDDAAPPALGAHLDGALVVALNTPIHTVSVVASDSGFASRAAADPRVLSIDAEPTLTLLLDEPVTIAPPNDPSLLSGALNGITDINASGAWSAAHTLGDAANVSICIVDTGVRYSHEDLNGTRWRGGFDFVNNDSDPMDDNGHGTHVAGIAAASINNSLGVAGVANVSLYAAKVLDFQGSGTNDVVAQGVTWCVDHTPPHTIISLSLGGLGTSFALENAVAYAIAQGKLVVAAAGNGGCNDCVLFPARLQNVVAVACSEDDRSPCSFSSKGPQVGIAAPGRNILSTWNAHDASYAYQSGTSMSTPFVSGALALAWSAHPELGATDLRARLYATARDVGALGHDDASGAGVLDAACLVLGTSPCGALPEAVTCGGVVDLGGYTCAPMDVHERVLPTNAHEFQLADDNDTAFVPLGFDFAFYQNVKSSVKLSSNGFLTFQELYSVTGCCAGQEVPDANAPNDVIAGFWTDLDPSAGGTIRYATMGSSPDREFVAEWRGIPLHTGGNATFQVVLHESTDEIETIILHAPPGGPVHVTGIEDAYGASGLRALYGADAAGPIAFHFTPPAHLTEPYGFAAAPGADNGTIALSWRRPLNVGNTSLLGYSLYRGNTSTTLYNYVAALPADATSYNDTNLQPHVRYHYSLQPSANRTPDGLTGVILGPRAYASGVARGDAAPCDTATDAAGYSCALVPFKFTDLHETGTPIYLGDDVVSDELTIGFNFTYYGRTYDKLYVGSNGLLGFYPDMDDGCCSAPPVLSSYIQDAIAVDWEDIYMPEHGKVLYQVIGAAPYRTLVVEWEDVARYRGRPHATFEALLHENTNTIEIQSLDVPDDGRHTRTVGLLGPTSSLGVQFRTGRSSLTETGVIFSPPALPAPDAPVNFTATNQTSSPMVDLSWGSPAIDPATSLLRYRLYRWDACAGESIVTELSTGAFTVPLPSQGASVRYGVAAVTGAGEGARATLNTFGPDGAAFPCVRIVLDPSAPDGLEGYYVHPVTARLVITNATTCAADCPVPPAACGDCEPVLTTCDGACPPPPPPTLDLRTLNVSTDGGTTFQPGDNVTLSTTARIVGRVLDTNGTEYHTAAVQALVDTTPFKLSFSGYVCCAPGRSGLPGPAPTVKPDGEVSTQSPAYEQIIIRFLSSSSNYDAASVVGVSSALHGIDGWHVEVYSSEIYLWREDGSIRAPPIVLDATATSAHGVPVGQSFAFTPFGPSVVSAHQVSAPNGLEGWYVTSPIVTLVATPSSARITYHIDGADDSVYNAPFAIPSGIHTLAYNATSSGLAPESQHVVTFRVDDQPPNIGDVALVPLVSFEGDALNISVPVSDSLSGVASVVLYANGYALQTGFDGSYANASIPSLTSGPLVLALQATDHAGNTRHTELQNSTVSERPAPAPAPTAPPPPPAPAPPPPRAPSAPGAPSVSLVAGKARVGWSAPVDPGTSAVAQYKLYRATDGGPAPLLATVGGDTFAFTDAAIAPGHSYAYSVSALSDAGEGARSAASTLTVPAPVSPTSGISLSPAAPDGADGWYTTPPTIALNASEGASVRYHFDGDADVNYTAPFTAPAGRHTLHWHAVLPGAPDEAEHSLDTKVDTTPPSIDQMTLSASNMTVGGPPLRLTVLARDVGSGIQRVDATAGSLSFPLVASADGSSFVGDIAPGVTGAYSITVRVTDRAGLSTTGAGPSFTVDPIPLAAPEATNATANATPLTITPPTVPTEGGDPLQPASTGAGGPGSSGGSPGGTRGSSGATTSTPAASTPPPAPPPPAVVLTPQNASINLAAGARGSLHVEIQNAEHPDRVKFYAVSANGTQTELGSGASGATWDTTQSPDGYYTVEAREQRDDGSTVTIASANVRVWNNVLTTAQAVAGAAAGVGTVVLTTLAANTITNTATSAATSTMTSMGSNAASNVVSTSTGSQGFSLTQYIKDLFTDAGSDALRDKTKNVADVERKRRIRSTVAVVTTVLLIAVFYSLAEASAWTWSSFLATLPFVGAASIVLALQKYGSESFIDIMSGARVRFRLWVAGVLSLLLSTLVFRSPFGYPGYVDNGEEHTEEQKRFAGHRALAILAVTSAWSLPFIVAAHLGFYQFGSVGIAMAISALATAAIPFGPLAGKEVWRWNKLASLGVAFSSLALYITYEIGILPDVLLATIGVIGLTAYALTTLRYHRMGKNRPHSVPVSTPVPVKDLDTGSETPGPADAEKVRRKA